MNPLKKNARISAAVSFATAAISLGSAVRDLRSARDKGDRLAMVDGLVSAAAVVTGLLVVYRALRHPEAEA